MTYDLENRLTSLDDGVAATSFLYDGQGKRLRATTGSDQVRYLWDPSYPNAEIVLERDGSNVLIRRHTPGIGGNPLAMNDGSATYYALPDQIGSTADLIGSSGTAQARYAYEPFGQSTETALVGSPPANPIRFSGEYQDPSGQLHLRARQYDPATGRFTARDPIDDGSGTSLYAYVSNRPGALIDPAGEFGIPSVDDLKAGAGHARNFGTGAVRGTWSVLGPEIVALAVPGGFAVRTGVRSRRPGRARWGRDGSSTSLLSQPDRASPRRRLQLSVRPRTRRQSS